MEEFNIQCKQISFYKYCPGTFGYTLVILLVCETGQHACFPKQNCYNPEDSGILACDAM